MTVGDKFMMGLLIVGAIAILVLYGSLFGVYHTEPDKISYYCTSTAGIVFEHSKFWFVTNDEFRFMTSEEFLQHCGEK